MAIDISKLKLLQDIRVNVTRYDKASDKVQVNPKTTNMAMADKLNQYIANLGYTNADIYNIALRLLTRGKVSLEFKSYVERLALADPSDKMYRMEAIAVIDKFMAGIRDDDDPRSMNITQKIVIHH